MKRNSFFGAVACAALMVASAPTTTNADFCELSWDKPCCPIPGCPVGVADVTLLICNCTDETAVYNYELFSPVQGVFFSPPNGTVTLQRGDCIEIPIKVYCPVPAPPGNMGIPLNAIVTNRTNGNQFECQGLVKVVQDFKVDPTDPTLPGTAPTPADPNSGLIPVSLSVSNLGSSGKDGVSISFDPMGPIAPLEPIFVPVAPGGTQIVEILARVLPPTTEGNPPQGQPTTGALLINWDDDGDGIPETNSSVSFLIGAPPCAGDLNGDGIVNGADLAGLLANWGMCF